MNIETHGLTDLLKELKGPLFRDVNRELRSNALDIATDMVPAVADAIRASAAPQAAAMADTVRAHRDRIPTVAVGKVNPKLTRFTRRGTRRDGKPRADVKLRRGQLAHGVVYGPAGGRRDARSANYYKISRDDSGGALGAAMAPGAPLYETAVREYLHAFEFVLERHGFTGPDHSWNGRG